MVCPFVINNQMAFYGVPLEVMVRELNIKLKLAI
jgi:hypothetical protein